MDNKQLAPYQPKDFDEIARIGKAMVMSGYFNDVKDVAQATVKVMAGAELGLPPFTSMTGIHIIKGKPALGANVIATLIKNDPRYNYRVTQMDDNLVSIDFYEGGELIGTSSFSAADAQKAGTQNMHKYPRNMLFARAISNGARWYTPGIFGGSPVYTPDELGVSVDEDGYIDMQPEQPQPDFTEGEFEAIEDGLTVVNFCQYAVDNIGRYDHVNAVKAALKKLGYTGIKNDAAERQAQYDTLVRYAELRDSGLSDDEVLAKLDEPQQLFDTEQPKAVVYG